MRVTEGLPWRVIERHRRAFVALERHLELSGELDEVSEEWVAEQVETSRLEGEVEEAAIAMTNVSLRSIGQVVELLSNIDEFSRSRVSGYLLSPDVVSGRPWCFAILSNIRRNFRTICCGHVHRDT